MAFETRKYFDTRTRDQILDELIALRAENAELQRELKLAQSFHRVACDQRDRAWRDLKDAAAVNGGIADELRAENARLREVAGELRDALATVREKAGNNTISLKPDPRHPGFTGILAVSDAALAKAKEVLE